jgi:hypothetical protein
MPPASQFLGSLRAFFSAFFQIFVDLDSLRVVVGKSIIKLIVPPLGNLSLAALCFVVLVPIYNS